MSDVRAQYQFDQNVRVEDPGPGYFEEVPATSTRTQQFLRGDWLSHPLFWILLFVVTFIVFQISEMMEYNQGLKNQLTQMPSEDRMSTCAQIYSKKIYDSIFAAVQEAENSLARAPNASGQEIMQTLRNSLARHGSYLADPQGVLLKNFEDLQNEFEEVPEDADENKAAF